jgi:hypothetical protein
VRAEHKEAQVLKRRRLHRLELAQQQPRVSLGQAVQVEG